MFTPHNGVYSSGMLTSLIRSEQREFEELVQMMEAGLLSDDQINARLKHLEKGIKCLRYSRPESFGGMQQALKSA